MKYSIIFFNVLLISLVQISIGCSGASSEFNIPTPQIPVVVQPQCILSDQDNCWKQSIREIQGCLSPTPTGQFDEFSLDRKQCVDGDKKSILFRNGDNYFLEQLSSFPQKAQFTAYSHPTACFEFYGDNENFTLLRGADRLIFETSENGDINIQCFGGEKYALSADEVSQGCGTSVEQKSLYWPGIDFQSQNIEGQLSWMFQFKGLGSLQGNYLVFNCR